MDHTQENIPSPVKKRNVHQIAGNFPLPPPLTFDLDDDVPLEPVAVLSEMIRLKLITRQCFGLNDLKTARIIAAMGELKKRDGKSVLLPCNISDSRYCNWVSGRSPMPLWRLGSTVAALEWYALEKVAVYRARGIGPQDPRLHLFNIGLEQLRAFSGDPRLTYWLPHFRAAILQRLQMDLQEGTIVVEQLNRYCDFLNDLAKDGGGK